MTENQTRPESGPLLQTMVSAKNWLNSLLVAGDEFCRLGLLSLIKDKEKWKMSLFGNRKHCLNSKSKELQENGGQFDTLVVLSNQTIIYIKSALM